jgi:hypothetical protein
MCTVTTHSTPTLCGVPIHIIGVAQFPLHSAPLLYEWRIYEGSTLTCLYVGKSRNGQSRPLKTYPSVVRDLRMSRGVKRMLQIPVKPYFKRNPWGFRWIHHQLEACVARIIDGNKRGERIELHFPKLGVPPSALHSDEAIAIASARKAHVGTNVVANGMPSMRVLYNRARHLLDPVWI